MAAWLNYVTEPGEPVAGPKLHCKHCHYTGKVRADYAPEQCQNERGWVDQTGTRHPKCRHRRLWYRWPDDFEPSVCTCKECLIIWEIEKKKVQFLVSKEKLVELVEV
jgi:hypothetical protein